MELKAPITATNKPNCCFQRQKELSISTDTLVFILRRKYLFCWIVQVVWIVIPKWTLWFRCFCLCKDSFILVGTWTLQHPTTIIPLSPLSGDLVQGCAAPSFTTRVHICLSTFKNGGERLTACLQVQMAFADKKGTNDQGMGQRRKHIQSARERNVHYRTVKKMKRLSISRKLPLTKVWIFCSS